MNVSTMTSPIGQIILLSDSKALFGVWFSEREPIDFLEGLGYQNLSMQSDEVLGLAEKQLNEYFEGVRKTFDIPLDYKTTAFRDSAWKSLRKIPYAQTRSYLDQAKMLGNPKASRAVGQANHHNPISIIIPCHRVIASNGKLTGYASGIEKKSWLLKHEKSFV